MQWSTMDKRFWVSNIQYILVEKLNEFNLCNFSIFVVNKDLLFMLLERISHWHDYQCIGDIFLDQVSKNDDHKFNSLVLPPLWCMSSCYCFIMQRRMQLYFKDWTLSSICKIEPDTSLLDHACSPGTSFSDQVVLVLCSCILFFSKNGRASL